VPQLAIDRKYFYDNFPSNALSGKRMTPERNEGFDAIFDAWDAVKDYDALEWLAYALATAWHETGGTMQPVREGFKKTDAEAYAHVTAYCRRQGIDNYARRHANGNSYYGRGYVQLTHATNYKKMGQRFGSGDKLYNSPDDVMKPKVAALILMTGMMEGIFRPKFGTLLDYFSGATQKWFDARDLINGDKNKKPKWAGGKKMGTLIADYGKAFFGALKYAVPASPLAMRSRRSTRKAKAPAKRKTSARKKSRARKKLKK